MSETMYYILFPVIALLAILCGVCIDNYFSLKCKESYYQYVISAKSIHTLGLDIKVLSLKEYCERE